MTVKKYGCTNLSVGVPCASGYAQVSVGVSGCKKKCINGVHKSLFLNGKMGVCVCMCVCVCDGKCAHTCNMYVPVRHKPTPQHCVHLYVQKTPPTLTPQHTLPSLEKKPSQMGGEMLNFPADDLAGSFTPHLWPSVAFHAAAGPSPPGPSTGAAERRRQDLPAAPETEVPPRPRTGSPSCPGGWEPSRETVLSHRQRQGSSRRDSGVSKRHA